MIHRDRWPSFTAEQIDFLQFAYPPRCKASNESLEDHMKYAGKVELVQDIANCKAIAGPDALDDLEDEVDRAIKEARGE